MMDWFGERLPHINATLDYQDLLNHGDDFKKLLDLKIIKYSQPIESVLCEWCEQAHPISPFVNKDNEIVLSCSGNRRVMKPDELKIWEIDTPRLLSLFQEAIGIENTKANESVAGLLWDLGTQEINGAAYHLFFSKNIDEVGKSIVTALPHSVVFYAGIPRASLPNKVLFVLLADLIKDVSDKGLSINQGLLKTYFPSGVHSTKDGDIELDDNIALQDNHILFEPLRGGVFKRQSKEKLPPLACKVIEHLYAIRKYPKHSKTLTELKNDLGHEKRVILKEIKRVQDLCEKNKLQEIFHKYAGNKYGINSDLSCCR